MRPWERVNSPVQHHRIGPSTKSLSSHLASYIASGWTWPLISKINKWDDMSHILWVYAAFFALPKIRQLDDIQELKSSTPAVEVNTSFVIRTPLIFRTSHNFLPLKPFLWFKLWCFIVQPTLRLVYRSNQTATDIASMRRSEQSHGTMIYVIFGCVVSLPLTVRRQHNLLSKSHSLGQKLCTRWGTIFVPNGLKTPIRYDNVDIEFFHSTDAQHLRMYERPMDSSQILLTVCQIEKQI